MTSRSSIQAAAASLLALGVAASVHAQPFQQKPGTEKCYGVAKAAQNDCGAAKHGCAGLGSETANDPAEWQSVAKGTCESMGGNTAAAQ